MDGQTNYNTITIKSGKEKQLLRHHPWVFSGAIETGPENMETAQVVRVETCEGRFIAWGWFDKLSHIQLHLLSWNEQDTIDDEWWRRTFRKAILRRKNFFADKNSTTTCFRLIHGEADMLPGFAVDVYGTLVRIIVSARVAWDHLELCVETIDALLHPTMIVVTTDAAFCGIEQLSETIQWYRQGQKFTPEQKLVPMRFRENGVIYEMIPGKGQKSGFYCDQRDNRMEVARFTRNAVVLDGCCYTGGFTLQALRAGAQQVDCFDSSDDALKQLLAHVHINQNAGVLPDGSRDRVSTTQGNIFELLRQIPQDHYDVMILDPPKLAQTKAQVENATKAYKDMNRVAMEKIKDGGIIATFSCSGAVTREQFRMILAWAAKDAGVELQILQQLGQGEDHPIRLSFPESEYLKGFIVRVMK